MDLNEAKRLIRILADGINPSTGEILPNNSPYNEPDVIRALFIVLESTNSRFSSKIKKTTEEKQKENISNGRPRNSGLPWNEESRSKLALQFQANNSIDDLASCFERTKGAIVSELKKQGLIKPGDEAAYL